MTKEAGGQAGGPVSLDQLRTLRSDYQDVPVPGLGGTTIRLWALSGTERAGLIKEISALSKLDPDGSDPEVIEKVLLFQCRVVAASMQLDPGEWDGLADAIGAGIVEDLYTVAAKLSRLEREAQAEALERLPAKRSTASGTD